MTEVRRSVFSRNREGSKHDGVDALIFDCSSQEILTIVADGRRALGKLNMAGSVETVDNCFRYNGSFLNDNYSGHRSLAEAVLSGRRLSEGRAGNEAG